MNVPSLAASIVFAHNSKSSAQAIDTSNIHRLELLRLPYVRDESALRVRFRFEAGVVDEGAYAEAQCAHAIVVARWEALASDSPRPRAPKRFDFARFETVDRELVTAPIARCARLFDPALVFPGWSEAKLQAREKEFLLDSSEPFAGLPVADPPAPARPVEAVLRELARKTGAEVVDSLAEQIGHEFCRKVRLVEAEWLASAQPSASYLLRASISQGRRTIVTELALGSGVDGHAGRIRLDEHLPGRSRNWQVAGATAALVAMLLGALTVYLRPDIGLAPPSDTSAAIAAP